MFELLKNKCKTSNSNMAHYRNNYLSVKFLLSMQAKDCRNKIQFYFYYEIRKK